MTPAEIQHAFYMLYQGGLAEAKRAAGDASAMPPWAETTWLGKQVVKSPLDLWVYQELLVETTPDLLIETGTSGAGSAYYFATIFDHLKHGRILTIDKDEYPALRVEHPRISYLVGDSVDPQMVQVVHEQAKYQRTMLSLDSLHTYAHVKRELEAYSSLVSQGCYCVIEDVHYPHGEVGDAAWGSKAAYEFQAAHPEFYRDLSRERHLMTANVWLRRL